MKSRPSVASAALLLCATFFAPMKVVAQDELYPGPSGHAHPDGRGDRVVGARRNTSGGAVVTGNGINYNGGAVMHGTVNVYFIWYGDWTQDLNAAAILNTWASTIGGTPYENINTTYGDNSGNVSGLVFLAGSTSVPSTTFGASLGDSNIASIVSNALTSHALPTDSNGVYFVLTAPGVSETSGFLSQYCGWHTYGTFGSANIKYAFVGDAGNQSGCSVQFNKSPNNDPPIDAMISVMSHELEETISDPNLNAWYDQAGEENADLCAWNFGQESTAPNGSSYNMTFGGHNYLIQQNWLNANGGLCAQSYTATPGFSLSVSPSSQTLAATGGTTGNYTITETPTGGFSGTPSYAVTGLPTGASATMTGSSTFTVTAAGVASGTHSFTITGTSNAVKNSATAYLVISAPPQPSFTISISPASQSVNRGGTPTYTVTIAPVNGFTGTVGLSVSGAKTGLAPSLSKTSIVTSGTSTLTAITTNSAKRGNDTLTITATYAGSPTPITKSAAATLKIN
jgi:hypothetical protein